MYNQYAKSMALVGVFDDDFFTKKHWYDEED